MSFKALKSMYLLISLLIICLSMCVIYVNELYVMIHVYMFKLLTKILKPKYICYIYFLFQRTLCMVRALETSQLTWMLKYSMFLLHVKKRYVHLVKKWSFKTRCLAVEFSITDPNVVGSKSDCVGIEFFHFHKQYSK